MNYQCSNPSCDLHGELFSEKLARRRDFRCESCGAALRPITNAAGRVESPNRVDLHDLAKRLPTVLAMPIADFLEETNPVVGLWHICEIAELSLRMLVLIGIAEHDKRLPAALVRELGDRIERPTMGSWFGMAQALSTHIPSDALAPELKESVEKLAAILGTQSSPPESGCLSLRNLLAHGGGMRRTTAEKYLTVWSPRVAKIVECLSWLFDCQIVGRDQQGQLRVLRGPDPQGEIAGEDVVRTMPTPAGGGDALWLVRGSRALLLWPLGRYAAPGADAQSAEAAAERFAQIYIRRGEVRLQYLNVGGDDAVSDSDSSALDSFLALFKVEEQPATVFEYSVRGFETAFRKEANRLIGREQELAALRDASKQMRGGLLWLGGVAGMGKSCLIAAAAVELLDTPPAGTLVLAYRFRTSDDRCFREAFIRFAVERLEPWDGLGPREKELPETTRAIDRLKECLARVKDGRRVLFMVDGLDEITERDAQFAQEVVLTLAAEKVGFICVGRPERGIAEAFRKAGAIEPFPGGLPPMSQADVRAMLVTRTEGQLRKRLVKRDKETGDSVTNPFIERVSRLSEGLPLYINYVVGDILSGKIAPEAERQLPAGLHAYHEELLRRCAIGDLQAIVTPMVATLSVAYEPLTAGELAALLVRRGVMRDSDVALVGRALVALASMIRRVSNAKGEEGYTLYHASLREHVLQSEGMRHTVGTTRAAMAEAAQKSAGDLAEKYLYRCGIRHLLDAGQKDDSLRILTDFDYVMARLQKLGGGRDAVAGYYRDWDAARDGTILVGDAEVWWDFVQSNRHLLMRANADWPVYKILLQLAVEYADDSPITKQVEIWLEEGRCVWLWLRNPQRVPHAAPDPCLAVFEGHTSGWFTAIKGALVLQDGDILSWSSDKTLRVWDAATGVCQSVLAGHTDAVQGGLGLSNGDVLSWSSDKTLRVWDTMNEGACRTVLEGHMSYVTGALVLLNGEILSWSGDKTLRIWHAATGRCRAVLEGHTDAVWGALELPDDSVLSWAADKGIRVWDAATGKCRAVLEGHTSYVSGTLVLPDGGILSWSGDKTLRVWDAATGTCRSVLEGHTGPIEGALLLPDGSILSWSRDQTLRIWNVATGECRLVFIGHTSFVGGALVLPDGGILSWSGDKTLRVWDVATGVCRTVLQGHAHIVSGAQILLDGNVLSWSASYNTLFVWNLMTGTCRATLIGHTGEICGALVLPDGGVLTWSADQTLRLWDSKTVACREILEGHTKSADVLVLPDGSVVSWADKTLRLWDAATGKCRAVLEGHMERIKGVLTMPDGGILSWSNDKTIRVWDPATGTCRTVLEGHTNGVWGALMLPDGGVLSWSSDKTLRVWDATTGKCHAVLEGHSDAVWGALVLPDGGVLSWSSKEKTLWVWNVKTGACRVVLEGHTKTVSGAKVLKNGDIISWSGSKSYRVWNTATGTCQTVERRGLFFLPSPSVSTPAGWAFMSVWNAVLLSQTIGSFRAVWQAPCACTGCAVFPDGTVLTTLGDGHVFFLKLHHGARRVTLDDASAILAQPQSTL